MIVLRRSTWKTKIVLRTLLKTLTALKIPKKIKIPSSTQNSSNSPDNDPFFQTVEVVTDANGDWSLEKLLVRADKKNRQILLDQEKDAISFVSWVIHGVSQSSIQNPYSLAIAKLKENPGISAGGASERLATISPRELARLIKQSITFYSPSDRDWRMLFAEAKRDRIRLLADELGLVFEIEEGPGSINS